MATILDAHPDIAMGYEIYEHLLIPPNPQMQYAQELIDFFRRTRKNLFATKKSEYVGFEKFIARAARSGVDENTVLGLLEKHVKDGQGLDDIRGRLFFVERVAREKASKECKRLWGAKIISNYIEIDKIFPGSFYLFMLRDGRDIAASRKMVGDFRQSVADIADGWRKQIAKFEEFSARSDGRAVFVPYERMAQNPESELRNLLGKLGLPWDDRILSFHELNLSIHRNSMGHLSGQQVKRPISTASIGRWRKDLTTAEVMEFEARAGESLERFGYL